MFKDIITILNITITKLNEVFSLNNMSLLNTPTTGTEIFFYLYRRTVHLKSILNQVSLGNNTNSSGVL